MAEHFKHCKYCGREFITTNHRIRYCSDECRRKTYEKYRLEASKKYNHTTVMQEKYKPKAHPERDRRIALSEITGVSYGIITANWEDKQKLKKIIEYKQSIGEAKPVDLNKLFETRGLL